MADNRVTCWECNLWRGGNSCEIREEGEWSPIYGYIFAQSICSVLNAKGNCKHYEPKPPAVGDKLSELGRAIYDWFKK